MTINANIRAAAAKIAALGNPDAATASRILQFTPKPHRSGPLNYRMVAKSADAAEIYLYDSIGGWGISAKQFSTDLKALGSPKTIDLRVNSDGGDVFDGRAIYTQLAQHSARIIARVDGIAASIASLICMAADEIRMGDGSFMMIHDAWAIAVGNKAEMRRMADLLDSVDSTIQETYAARTRQPLADIKQMCADETWMTAKEAVDKSFADVMDEPVKVAASIADPSRFRNLPAVLRPNRAKADAAIARIAARIKTA